MSQELTQPEEIDLALMEMAEDTPVYAELLTTTLIYQGESHEYARATGHCEITQY